MDKALIVFVRNLQPGKVKTRLATAVGDVEALSIYTNLLQYTYKIIGKTECDKYVYYSEYLENTDTHSFDSHVQSGADLGDRMKNAFIGMFNGGYEKAIIIGSDTFEITSDIIMHAFDVLDENDVVVGPAADGGYYLLGMTNLHKELFEEISWSTSSVFKTTVMKMGALGLKHGELETLNDIDVEDDWIRYQSKLNL